MIFPAAGAIAATTAALAANAAAQAALIVTRGRGGGCVPDEERCPHCGKSLSKPAKPAGRLRRLSDTIRRRMDVVLIDYMPLSMAVFLLVVFGGFGLTFVLWWPYD